MDLSFLEHLVVPVIIGSCLCVGYLLKHWVRDVDDRIIPTVCAAVGVALAVWINWPAVTPQVLLSGAVSGLASTGLHQAFHQFLNGK